MKVLVTGAGGYLGEHIVHAAVKAGHEVVAFVRRTGRSSFPNGVRLVEGDLNDIGCVQQALAGVEAVVFSAGRNWQPGLPGDEYLRQNVSIVKTFLMALAKFNPTARVVFTSSMAAIAGSSKPIIFTETSDRDAICMARLSPYDCAKVECERLVRNAVIEGRQLTILYPGLMLGPGVSASSNVTTTTLVQWFCLQRIPAFIGHGGSSFCDVRDVAQAHVAAIEKGLAASRYIAGGENLSWVEFQHLMSEQTGIRCPIQVPAQVAVIGAAVMDAISAGTFRLLKSPVHRTFARAASLYYWGDSTRAAHDLDYRNRPLAETIRDTIADFVKRGMLPNGFRYIETMTDETRMSLLLLQQLANGHLHRSYLITRLSDILAVCHRNLSLNEALNTVLASSYYDFKRGQIGWRSAKPTSALMKLHDFLDYFYYASDAFRERVM